MKENLNSFVTFLNVIHEGYLTKVTVRVDTPQSAINQTTSNLEHRLQLKRINRTIHSLTLTEMGQKLISVS